jgi:acyl carrier protein
MEALFRRRSRATSANKLFWDQAQTPGERRWSDYASNPLKGRVARELIPQLKEDLRQSLPEYMLPSAFVVLDALPLSANGKVDRRALPVPGDIRVGTGVEYLAPRNEAEERLAQIWAEVLKLERVGINDNFFDMGGHSLIATQVVSRMREQLGIELPLSEMFGYPTVGELAQKLDLIRWTNQKRGDGVLEGREVFRL